MAANLVHIMPFSVHHIVFKTYQPAQKHRWRSASGEPAACRLSSGYYLPPMVKRSGFSQPRVGWLARLKHSLRPIA